MSATNAVSARLIGAIFLERGLVTQEQLQAALAIQVETKEHLGEILVQHFGVSRIELASVLAEQWAELERANAGSAGPGDGTTNATSPQLRVVEGQAEAGHQSEPRFEPTPQAEEAHEDEEGEGDHTPRPLGEILAEQGLVTDAELDRALERQRQGGEKLGEILVAQGSITRLQLASALADQWTALRKIRPPSAPEPQQPLTPPPVVRDTSAADVERLHEAVSALEQRLRAAESVAAREPWREDIKSATDAVQASVAEMEAKVAAAATREELEAIEGLRSALDELTGRVEEISSPERKDDPELVRRVEAAAEAATAARSSLDGAFESLSLRLADVESRVHDRSDITRLQEQLGDLAQRVSETDGGQYDSELEELRNEVQRLLDEVTRRSTASSEPDPALANRVEKLTLRVEEIGHSLQGIEGGKRSKIDDALRDAMAALAARVEKLESGDGAGLEELRSSLSELQARVPIDSPLADRLSRYGSGPDELNALQERIEEIERRTTELAEQGPALSEHVGGLAARLETLEGSTLAETLGGELTALRASVEELAARPVADPALAGRVGQIAAELAETAAAATQMGELRGRVDALAADSGAVGAVAAEVEAVRSQLGRLDELAGRLHTLENESGSLDDLRNSIAAIAARPAGDPDLLAELSRRIEEVSAATRELDELRAGLSSLGSRLDSIADRATDAVPADQIWALAARLEALESTNHADEIAALHRSLAELATRPAGDPALAARVEALARELEVNAGTHPQLEALGARVGELARQAGAAARVTEDFDELRSRLDSLSTLDARVGVLEGAGEAIDGLRGRIDELADRPTADVASVDQLARRVDELSGLAGQIDGLRSRLDTVAAEASAPHEDVAELRRELAELGQRLDSVGDQGSPPAPSGEVDALATRVEALESATNEAGLQALREQVQQLTARPAADPELAGRVEQLAGALEEIASTRAQLDELRARMDAAETAEAPERPDEHGPRLDAIEHRLTEGESRDAGVEALENGTNETGLQTLRQQVEELAARPSADPELAGRVEQLAGALEEIASTRAQLDELRARMDAPRDETELAVLRENVEQLAAHPAADPELAGRVEQLAGALEEIESTRAQLDELRARMDAAETAEAPERPDEHGPRLDAIEHRLTEGESRDAGVEARLEEVASRLGAVDELPARLDAIGEQLAAQEQRQAEWVGRAELTGLHDGIAEQLASMGQRLRELGEGTRKSHRAFEQRVEEIVAAVTAEAGEHRIEIVDRVAEIERDAAQRRSEIAELRGAAGLDEVRAELDALTARVTHGDAAAAAALQAFGAQLETRFEAEATRTEEQIRATEAALQAGLEALGERLAETESTYTEAGDALRESIERLGSAIADDTAADDTAADRTAPEAPAAPDAEPEVAGLFLAFVPNGGGYSLQEVDGVAPVVGQPMLVPDRDGEFVVTRIGRSPLPLDGRRCAYLELRPDELATADRVP